MHIETSLVRNLGDLIHARTYVPGRLEKKRRSSFLTVLVLSFRPLAFPTSANRPLDSFHSSAGGDCCWCSSHGPRRHRWRRRGGLFPIGQSLIASTGSHEKPRQRHQVSLRFQGTACRFPRGDEPKHRYSSERLSKALLRWKIVPSASSINAKSSATSIDSNALAWRSFQRSRGQYRKSHLNPRRSSAGSARASARENCF
jgi:hypothetical protein